MPPWRGTCAAAARTRASARRFIEPRSSLRREEIPEGAEPRPPAYAARDRRQGGGRRCACRRRPARFLRPHGAARRRPAAGDDRARLWGPRPSLRRPGRTRRGRRAPAELNAWLKIAPDDSITVLVDRSEMGQGVYTALPMLLAEELEVDFTSIRIVAAPVGDAYVNAGNGGQITGTSNSVTDAWEKLRTAGAQARALLIAAAADKWRIAPERCSARRARIENDRGQSFSYGQLAQAAAKLKVPKDVKLKSRADYTLIGTPQRRLDTPGKVDGSAEFGLDVKLPGMLYAAIAQCPVLGGRPRSVGSRTAEAMPGVRRVLGVPSGVVVVAEHFWQALKARDALEIVWDEGTNASLDNAAIRVLLDRASANAGLVAKQVGDPAAAIKTAAHTFRRRLRVAAARACHDGAHELHGGRAGGPLRFVRRHAGAAAGAGSRGRGGGSAAGSSQRRTPPCSAAASGAAWRWISFPPPCRLQGGRCAGEARLDSRRRHDPRLLPAACTRGGPRRARCPRQARRVAAAHHQPVDYRALRSHQQRSLRLGDRVRAELSLCGAEFRLELHAPGNRHQRGLSALRQPCPQLLRRGELHGRAGGCGREEPPRFSAGAARMRSRVTRTCSSSRPSAAAGAAHARDAISGSPSWRAIPRSSRRWRRSP